MTSDRRYYSGALSKAVTKYSCLLRSDAELLLERCETFRRNKSTAFIFNGKRFTNATACAVRIRQTGFLGLRRWQITKTLQASSRTSLKPNFMFDRTRPTIRTLCVASHWVMIKHQSCEGTIQYSSRTSRRAGKNLKRRDSGPWHGVTDTVCIAWHNTDSRMCHVLRFGGGGGRVQRWQKQRPTSCNFEYRVNNWQTKGRCRSIRKYSCICPGLTVHRSFRVTSFRETQGISRCQQTS